MLNQPSCAAYIHLVRPLPLSNADGKPIRTSLFRGLLCHSGSMGASIQNTVCRYRFLHRTEISSSGNIIFFYSTVAVQFTLKGCQRYTPALWRGSQVQLVRPQRDDWRAVCTTRLELANLQTKHHYGILKAHNTVARYCEH